MSKTRSGSATDRRSFLKLAGLGTVAGGAALAAAGKPAEALESGRPEGAGYRETAQVRAYYASARF